jgi:hypothetical protein
VGASFPLWVPIAVALIATSGVLVAATLTAVATARRERAARRADAESQRLAELAEAAVALWEVAAAEGAAEDVARSIAVFVARAEAVASPAAREAALVWERLLHEEGGALQWPELVELLREVGRARRDAV